MQLFLLVATGCGKPEKQEQPKQPNYEGTWEGTTSTGQKIILVVKNNKLSTAEIQSVVKAELGKASGETTFYYRDEDGAPIVANKMAMVGRTRLLAFDLHAEFTNSPSASGDLDVALLLGCPIGTGHVKTRWTAARKSSSTFGPATSAPERPTGLPQPKVMSHTLIHFGGFNDDAFSKRKSAVRSSESTFENKPDSIIERGIRKLSEQGVEGLIESKFTRVLKYDSGPRYEKATSTIDGRFHSESQMWWIGSTIQGWISEGAPILSSRDEGGSTTKPDDISGLGPKRFDPFERVNRTSAYSGCFTRVYELFDDYDRIVMHDSESFDYRDDPKTADPRRGP